MHPHLDVKQISIKGLPVYLLLVLFLYGYFNIFQGCSQQKSQHFANRSVELFQFQPLLLFLVLLDVQQHIHILLDDTVFLGFSSCYLVLRIEPFLFCLEIDKLRFHAFRCWQRNCAQPLALPGGGFKKDDLALMPSQKLFLIPGRLIAVVDWFELAVGADVLHLQDQFVDLRPGIPKIRFKPGNRGGRRLAPIHQFLIAADTMLRQKVGDICNPFEIFDGRPAAIACALLRLDVVLDINEQADLSAPLFRLVGRSGASGDPGGKSFFSVVHTQGFQTGEPFLSRRFGRDILAPLDLIALTLQAAEQFFQIGTGWQEPVNGRFQLRLITGAVLRGLMFDIALALILSGDDDGQTVFLAKPVGGAADIVIRSLSMTA